MNIFNQYPDFLGLPIPLKILKINEIIKSFPEEKKIDICENCRKQNGDFKNYNKFLQDTSICSICFLTNDLLNYSILDLVEQSRLEANDYYNYVDKESNMTYNGLRLTKSHNEKLIIKNSPKLNDLDLKNELLALYEKYQPYVYIKDEHIRENKWNEFRKEYHLIDKKYYKYDFFEGEQYLLLRKAFNVNNSYEDAFYKKASKRFLEFLRNKNLEDARKAFFNWFHSNKKN